MSDIIETMVEVENPFPGLRPYDIQESHLFFGRGHQVDELLRKLSLYHFVSVVGTSGSGKSSLVRAGLLAKLYRGYEAEKGSGWIVAVMRPGANPILNLATALFENDIFGKGLDSKSQIEEAYQILNGSDLGFIQLVRTHIKRGSNLLLLVDQFEELFRFAGLEGEDKSQKEADHFVKLLIEAVKQQDAGIYVVMTLRADFLGDCSAFEGLPEAINNGQYLIPRLNREHYKSAIEGPVTYASGKIAPRLVQQLLSDMSNNQDQLPILQHALMRSWENWTRYAEPGEPMDIENYEAVGGMEKALNLHANEAYEELDDKKKKLAELIFKCITVKGLDNRGIRRPTKLKDICAITQASDADVIRVLNVFRKSGRGFIMPAEGVSLYPETVIDISHESLMRNWERLKDWVDEEYESAQMYIRISESAILYKNGVAGLWREPELSVALDWKGKNNPHKAWALQYNDNFDLSMSFLDSSVKEKQKMLSDKRLRRVITNIIVVIFLLSAGGLTLWATLERSKATKNEEIALKEKGNAEKQEKFAREKEAEAEKNFQTEEFQKIKAEEERVEADRQRKEAIKQKLIANNQVLETRKQTIIAQAERRNAEEALIKANKETIIAKDEKRRADSIADLAIFEIKAVKLDRQYITAKALAKKSLTLINNRDDSVLQALFALQAYKYNLENKTDSFNNEIVYALFAANKAFANKNTAKLSVHTDDVKGLATSPDGKYLASVSTDGKLILWTLTKDRIVPSILKELQDEFSTVAFSPDNKWLAVSSGKLIYLWDLASKETKPNIISGHKARITCLVFAPDALFSSGYDSTIIMNRLSGNLPPKKAIMDVKVSSLAYSGIKNKVAVGLDDGSIYTINLNNVKSFNPELLVNARSSVTCLSFNSTGALLAAGYIDGSLQVWYSGVQKPQLEEKLDGHKAAVTAVAFGRGNQLASAGLDGKVKLWQCLTSNKPVVFSEHDGAVISLAISPDGKTIYSGGHDKTIRLYGISQDALADRLRKKVTRNFTQAEWSHYMGDAPYEKVVETLP